MALPSQAQATQSTEQAESTTKRDADEASPRDARRFALPAERLMDILQQRPEAMIELKTLMARKISATSAAPISSDQISDEELFTRLTQSSALRESATMFLRSRGYVTDADLREAVAAKDTYEPTELSAGELYPRSPLPNEIDDQLPKANDTSLSLMSSAKAREKHSGAKAANHRNDEANAEKPLPESDSEQPRILHRPAPYNLLAMRDLYSQIAADPEPLKRFGADVFVSRDTAAPHARGGSFSAADSALEVPPGPEYVVGPGDVLSIQLWGGLTQNLIRPVAADGRVLLPEAGSVQVAGLALKDVQAVIAEAFRRQYRDVQTAVTVSQLRSVRVYVVGDVQRPGAYEVSSLASPLNALYAAGGPTSVGSLRTLRLMRAGREVAEIDLYDFLVHGVQHAETRVQSGDTLLVPPAGAQVTIYGAIKRPAIYELKGKETLSQLIDEAGGLQASASLTHVTVERIDAEGHRETVSINSSSAGDASSLAAFGLRDGDRVRISPILPYSERVIYLDGHVVRPGRTAYRDGMRLNDVLRSYADLLPEPAPRGEIVRLVPPDLHAETIDFNVADVLIGNLPIALQPFDTIRVFGRYEADAPEVTIGGEVLRPGAYPLSAGMTAAQLVRIAGGFKRGALRDSADLTSYTVLHGEKVVGERTSVRIGEAVATKNSAADVLLKPGDVLTIHQISGWRDIGASIRIEGEVAHPGSYGFQEGERLSSVLRRAGGFRTTSYPDGAVLVREQVRELEEKSRAELIRQIETSSSAARLAPNLSNGDSTATLQLIQQQQDQVLARLRSAPASGRLVIHITADIDAWADTPADIEVRRGDVLTVPKRPGFVLVTGQVYNASAITYAPGKSAGWYLRRAGGASEVANKKEIFVIRANGSVVGRNTGGWFDGNVLSTKLDPGDVVVVPQKIMGASVFWKNLLTTAQLASSIAITAAVAGL